MITVRWAPRFDSWMSLAERNKKRGRCVSDGSSTTAQISLSLNQGFVEGGQKRIAQTIGFAFVGVGGPIHTRFICQTEDPEFNVRCDLSEGRGKRLAAPHRHQAKN